MEIQLKQENEKKGVKMTEEKKNTKGVFGGQEMKEARRKRDYKRNEKNKEKWNWLKRKDKKEMKKRRKKEGGLVER